jgi:asparagine synthase (glutamine-hydrolysing)
MCGICGVYQRKETNQPKDNLSLVQQMCRMMIHRGPDDEGFYQSQEIVLGMRRLSIIDLAGGHQPVSNETKKVWVIFNGEIYNYLLLRENLIKKGHRFSTRSDTEVIVHLYEDYGKNFPSYLRGMFALALWDDEKKIFILVRDRIGIKPLYFIETDKKIIFASEIKSLCLWQEFKKEVNLNALDCYLSLGYVLGPETMFVQVNKLLPGYLLYAHEGKISFESYWDLNISHPPSPKKEEYYLEKIEEKLTESINLRLRADVPLGVFLSGGIDSSSIVGLMKKLGKTSIKTFTVGYKKVVDSLKGEMAYARTVARHLGVEYNEILIDAEMFWQALLKFVWAQDEPIANFSHIPLYYLAELAKKQVTVVLSGIGGDELLAGYSRHTSGYFYLWGGYYYQKLFPRFLREKMIYPFLRNILRSPHFWYRHQKLNSAGEFFINTYAHSLLYSDEMKKNFYSKRLKNSLEQIDAYTRAKYEELFHQHSTHNWLDYLYYLDLKTWIPENALIGSDKITMAHSLEQRVPFFDHQLVEAVVGIPKKIKLKNGQPKYLLYQIMKNILPAEIINRPKTPFNVPLYQWFTKELLGRVEKVIFSPRAQRRGYFNEEYLKRMLAEHKRGEKNYSGFWFRLLNLELWHHLFIDQTGKGENKR